MNVTEWHFTALKYKEWTGSKVKVIESVEIKALEELRDVTQAAV